MKILLCTTSLGYGGAETHVCSLAAGLLCMGHSVTVASSGGELVASLPAGVRHVKLPAASRSPFDMLALNRALGRVIAQGDYDVVHAHARIPAFLCRRHAKKHGCRFVVTAHARFRMTPVLRRMSVWGERTIAVSEDIKQHIIDNCGIYPGHITTIPNGIDTSRFTPPEERRQEARRILFVSRMDNDCSLVAGLLCRIAGRLYDEYPDIKITLTGGGNDAERIRALAGGVNVACGQDIIEVTGGRSDIEVLMREADIFVGVSRAALEAAATGLPVILAGNEGYAGILSEKNIPGHSNFCGRGLPLPDAERLYADIKKVIAMRPEERCALGDFGRRYVIEHHSSHSVAAAVAAVYEATPKKRPKKGKEKGCGGGSRRAEKTEKARKRHVQREEKLRGRLDRRDEENCEEKTLFSQEKYRFSLERIKEKAGFPLGRNKENGEAARQKPGLSFGREKTAQGTDEKKRRQNRLCGFIKRRGVVICGYYGFSNAGDNALLDTLLAGLLENIPASDIRVLTARPSVCKKRFGVKCISRTNIFSMIFSFLRVSFFILGGGTLLQDATSRRSLRYYLFVSNLSCRLGCRLIVWGSGLGPLKSHRSRRQTAKLLSRAEFIGLREAAAYDLLRSFGVSLRRAEVFADPALLIKPESGSRIDFLLSRIYGNTGERFIAVSLREPPGNIGRSKSLRSDSLSIPHGNINIPDDGEKSRRTTIFGKPGRSRRPSAAELYEIRLADALDSLCAANEAVPLFFVLSPEDRKISERVSARMKLSKGGRILPYLTVPEIVGLLSRCEIAVGMRLHMLVFALNAGVPAVGVAADPKIAAFLDYAGLPAPLPAALPRPEDLAVLAARILDERGYYTAKMAERRAVLSALARREIELVSGIVSRVQAKR